MRLTTLLLTVALIEAHAGGNAQSLHITGQNIPLKKVFSEIKHQTGYTFFYNYDLLREAHPVSLDVRNASLEQVLKLCFSNQPLDYFIENKTIVVTRRTGPPAATGPIADSVARVVIEDVDVRGRVSDEQGQPLVGVSIKVKGQQTGTTTDPDGIFSLHVPAHTTLLISYIGYVTKEVVVEKAGVIAIHLARSNTAMDEVVVTGLGETRAKRSLGYSVTQVSGDQIRSANTVDPITAIQGMVTGLQVQPGLSGPSATPRFQIRGSSSLDPYQNTPLIVVDGVILDQSSVLPNESGQYGSNTDFGNILKDINPDDIESLSVLKGGAVVALYGSRANNGVILIKTRKGYHQKGIGISLTHSDFIDHPYKTVDYQNTYGSGVGLNDFDTAANGQLSIDPSTYGISFGPRMTGQKVMDVSGTLMNNVGTNPLGLFRNGVTDNTNISLSSATDNNTFRLSYSHLTSNGISPNNELKRNSVDMRVTHKVASKILADVTVDYVQTGTWNPGLQGGNSPLYALAYDVARNYNMPYWASHYIDSVHGGVNTNDVLGVVQGILYPLYENNDYLVENNFRGSAQLTANVTPWLDLLSTESVNIYNRNEYQNTRGTGTGFAGASYSENVNILDQFRYNASFYLHKNVSKDWLLTLQGGGELFTWESRGSSASTNGTILPDIYRLSNSQKAPTITEAAPNTSQLASLFFQGSFQYKNTYFLNYYGRNDWNSTLVYNDGHGDYSYFYPGVDLAWVFTDALHLPKWFDYGKLRLSYNSSGNGDATYVTNTGNYIAQTPYIGANGTTVNYYGYQSNTLPNQHLVPERSDKFEAGVEFKMFHERLGGDATVYTQDTKSQIIPFTAPLASGVSNVLINAGTVRNKGIELTLFGTPILTKDFSWVTRFNYTLNRNKVISLPLGTNYLDLEDEDGIRTVAVKGGDYALLVARYGYARYQAKDGSGNNVGSPLNGQHVITMIDGAGGTFPIYQRAQNYGTDPTSQEPVIGSTLPKFLGSWINTFNYKRFSLNVFLDAKFGGLEYSTTYYYGSQNGNLKNTLFGRTAASGGIAYTPQPNSASFFGQGTAPRQDGIGLHGVFASGTMATGQDGKSRDVSGMTYDAALKAGYVQPVDAPDYYIATYSWGYGIREAGVFKSSWVAVRQISLGYDLPTGWASKMRMNNLRAVLSVRNPFYLYNSAPDHINPDNLNDSGSGAAFERGGIPYVRSYGFSLNAGF
ncbi:SusC/RagA family TonB-linked outer membrane protein [Dinghuibacter silviterrae]|nr:SusC/RagA family TonB-linked outer membrane protein [Dinghuibacter silviterrae]